IAMGLSLVAVLLLAGNVTLGQVIARQQEALWFIFPLTLAFVFFAISALAETNRLPFDLPETEPELVAGYHAEYSAMKFAMFYMAEYAALMTMSAMMATLFFGGWDIPFTTWDDVRVEAGAVVAGEPSVLKTILTLGTFGVKTVFFIFCYIWVRWTLPRFRFDQLMALGWKFMLPAALGYIVIMAVSVWVLESAGLELGWLYGMTLFVLNLVLLGAWFRAIDRGHTIRGQHVRRLERA
ncbi:MAG: NADH-quinone oxidoreductase subunit H, partial [Armatimonadota bacterium]